MKSVRELIEKRNKAYHRARKLLDRADAEKRELTATERDQYDRLDAEIDHANAEIQRRRTAPHDRQTDPSRLGGDQGEPIRLAYGTDRRTGSARELTLRPGTGEYRLAQDSYRANFLSYLQTGQEQLGLMVGSNPKGGYLAPLQMVVNLIQALDNLVWVRQLANVLPPAPSAVSIGVPSFDTDVGDADWTAEVPASDISDDDNAPFGMREFVPHLMTKLVKMSTKLLRSSVIDVDGFITDRIAYKAGTTEENAFLNGDGSQQPLGMFVASDDGIATSRDITASSATAFTMDDVINVYMNCKAAYRANGSWIFAREFHSRLRKLKGADAHYLLPGHNNDGDLPMLMNRPIYESEYAPSTFTTGLYVAIFGDLKAGYIVQDALDMEVQRLMELFALKNQVGILVRKETDGAPVLGEAFSRLKLL